MGDWTTITFKLIDHSENEHGKDAATVVQDQLHDRFETVWTGVLSISASDGNQLVVALIGDPVISVDENEDDLLADLDQYVTEAVVIHASSTSMTGNAYFYKYAGGEVVQVDKFTEHHDDHGSPLGTRAASYMHVEHGIPAVARPDGPGTEGKFYDHTKRDDYTYWDNPLEDVLHDIKQAKTNLDECEASHYHTRMKLSSARAELGEFMRVDGN